MKDSAAKLIAVVCLSLLLVAMISWVGKSENTVQTVRTSVASRSLQVGQPLTFNAKVYISGGRNAVPSNSAIMNSNKQLKFGSSGPLSSFIVRREPNSGRTGCVRWNDKIRIAKSRQGHNTGNCGWYGCRVASMSSANLMVFGHGRSAQSFYVRPRSNRRSSATGCVRYGDEVMLAMTSQTYNTNNCGWYGCRVFHYVANGLGYFNHGRKAEPRGGIYFQKEGSVNPSPTQPRSPTKAPAPAPTPVRTPVPQWASKTFRSSDFDRRHEACFVMVNGKGYLLGGRGNKRVGIYDPKTQRWTNKPGYRKEVHHFQCVAVKDEIFIVSAWTGGYPRETNLDKLLVYNTKTFRWDDSSRTPLNSRRRRGGSAAVLHGGNIYVSHGNRGGHGSHATSLTWLDKYNIATDRWTVLPNARYARDHTGGAIVNGNLMCVAGGRDGGSSGFSNKVVLPTECFNLQRQRWEVHPNIPQGRAGSAYGQTCDGKLMIAGGEGFGRAYNNVDVYDGKSWKNVDSLNIARHGTGLAISCGSCKHIVIASGSGDQGGTPELNSVETLYPQGTCRP